MDLARLRLLGTLRDTAQPGHPETLAHAVEAFVCLLTGRIHGEPTDEERLLARRIAAHAAAQGSPTHRRAHAFRAAYEATVTADRVIDLTDDPPPGLLALEDLVVLPRAQRAALALGCLLGFAEAEVAFVIGVRPSAVRAVIDDGIRTIRARARAAAEGTRRPQPAGRGRAA